MWDVFLWFADARMLPQAGDLALLIGCGCEEVAGLLAWGQTTYLLVPVFRKDCLIILCL